MPKSNNNVSYICLCMWWWFALKFSKYILNIISIDVNAIISITSLEVRCKHYFKKYKVKLQTCQNILEACGNVGPLCTCWPLVHIWSPCEHVESLWTFGTLVDMWSPCGHVGPLWTCGVIVDMWGPCGHVGSLWTCGALVDMWGYCGHVGPL